MAVPFPNGRHCTILSFTERPAWQPVSAKANTLHVTIRCDVNILSPLSRQITVPDSHTCEKIALCLPAYEFHRRQWSAVLASWSAHSTESNESISLIVQVFQAFPASLLPSRDSTQNPQFDTPCLPETPSRGGFKDSSTIGRRWSLRLGTRSRVTLALPGLYVLHQHKVALAKRVAHNKSTRVDHNMHEVAQTWPA